MAGPARGGFRGYFVPGPRRAQKSSGFRFKFWYRIVTSLQLQRVSNLALSVFVEPGIAALCIAANT